MIPSLFGWNNYTKKPQRPRVWDRQPRPTQAVDRTPEDDTTVEMEVGENTVSGCTELASTPLMEDHDYTASSFIVVDREKFESMSRQIEELTRQIETLHMERFGLQQFSTSPSDIHYYSRMDTGVSVALTTPTTPPSREDGHWGFSGPHNPHHPPFP
ncbi:unnamed protein product [Boreogadus saida]